MNPIEKDKDSFSYAANFIGHGHMDRLHSSDPQNDRDRKELGLQINNLCRNYLDPVVGENAHRKIALLLCEHPAPPEMIVAHDVDETFNLRIPGRGQDVFRTLTLQTMGRDINPKDAIRKRRSWIPALGIRVGVNHWSGEHSMENMNEALKGANWKIRAMGRDCLRISPPAELETQLRSYMKRVMSYQMDASLLVSKALDAQMKVSTEIYKAQQDKKIPPIHGSIYKQAFWAEFPELFLE